MAFETPFYECVPKNGKRCTVDVTKSVPNQKGPPKVIRQLIDLLEDEKIRSVCDVGAGRMRNVQSFLTAGYTVYVVEYDRLFPKNSANVKRFASLEKQYGKKLQKLIFPGEFRAFPSSFDLILLIFVLHIIPDPQKRKLLISYCFEKLRPGGLLFCASAYGDTHTKRLYRDDLVFGDGHLFNARTAKQRIDQTGADDKNTYQTFYAEIKARDLKAMFLSKGFEFVKPLDYFKNVAHIYRRPSPKKAR